MTHVRPTTVLMLLLPALLAACNSVPPSTTADATALLSPRDLRALPRTPADQRIAYGTDAEQFGELRVPRTPGPHPLVVLIHGGCWRADYASLADLAPMADALKADGIATWNIEYRRLPQPGSGWPGTYRDVAQALDHVRVLAPTYALDLQRVVVLGHSVGGHLAIWAAARARLPRDSALYVADPLPLAGVVNLAGAADLAAFHEVDINACGVHVVEPMLGGTPASVPERYTQTSPIQLLPLGVPQVQIWGGLDDITPIRFGQDYARAAIQAGDLVHLVTLPTLGHFDTASPAAPSWPQVRAAISGLLAAPRQP